LFIKQQHIILVFWCQQEERVGLEQMIALLVVLEEQEGFILQHKLEQQQVEQVEMEGLLLMMLQQVEVVGEAVVQTVVVLLEQLEEMEVVQAVDQQGLVVEAVEEVLEERLGQHKMLIYFNYFYSLSHSFCGWLDRLNLKL
jgi:hypothetical protein